MAPRTASRAAPRLLALGGLAVALRSFGGQGPAYVVKGSWSGEPSVLEKAIKGDFEEVTGALEPKVGFPDIAYKTKGGAVLSVEDGELNLGYATSLDEDTSLSFKTNTDQAWTANMAGGAATLKVKGQGTDLSSIAWAAAQDSSVEGVGDVKLEFNSDKAYNLTVTPAQMELLGATLAAKVRAANAGITGKFEASRDLGAGVTASYTAENPVGVYDFDKASHIGRVTAEVAGGAAALEVQAGADKEVLKGSYHIGVAGGEADLKVSRDAGALGYNVSYARALGDLLPGSPDVQVGVDEDGVYGKVSASHAVGDTGLDAYYEALGRLGLGDDKEEKLSHALKISNALGYAQLLHGKGEAPRLRVGYEFSA